MKEVIILFGEMGAGKNYWGKIIAERHGLVFFDADTVIPPEMSTLVRDFKPIPREMISRFVDDLGGIIADKADANNGVVVAQALYTDEDRKFLLLFLNSLGYKVHFVWITTSTWKNFKQLLSRDHGWRWVAYWLMSKPWFQKPTHKYESVY